MNDIGVKNNITENEFSRWAKIRERGKTTGQSFEEDPKIKRNGKIVSLKEYTNTASKDTNIYDVMAKYDGNKQLTAEAMKSSAMYISEEMAEIKSMSDALNRTLAAKKVWSELPLEIRKEFANNRQNFLLNGKAWAEKKIKEINDLTKTVVPVVEQAQAGGKGNG